MKKEVKLIIISYIIDLILLNVVFGFMKGIGNGFYYLYTSSLYIIFPFLILITILVCEVKKIEWKRNAFLEVYLAILIIAGTLQMYLFSKIDLDINIIIWLLISTVVYIISMIVYYFFSKFIKNKDVNGPKFIANK